MIIDTHTHLYSEQFDGDRTLLIKEAIENGIERFYLPSIDSNYARGMYDLEQSFPENIRLMMGLHPCSVKPETWKQELEFVKQELERRTFSAVGEIGIDLYWDQSTLEIQKKAFAQQIEWAKEKSLPIVIHCRNSFDEIFEVLEEHKSEKLFGIFHCFTGTKEQAEHAISFNMKLGIGGVVTFKNGKIDQFLNEIPLEHIVLETDAPYLSPKPFRGKRNIPIYILKVVEKLAEIYGISIEEISKQTSENALSVFE